MIINEIQPYYTHDLMLIFITKYKVNKFISGHYSYIIILTQRLLIENNVTESRSIRRNS
ncbi:hypothetical protein AGR4B_Lc70162 [Agrobacterium tumefaciens str. CFBP 5621]|nr:hypothetical protein AGR4B_Lc70162 [Agrobacterium tumefaciens str. CFBP 5621]